MNKANGMLKRLWERWKKIAEKVGNIQARVILSIFYFVIVAPVAITVKVFSDPLSLKQNPKDSYWLPKEPLTDTLQESKRQY